MNKYIKWCISIIICIFLLYILVDFWLPIILFCIGFVILSNIWYEEEQEQIQIKTTKPRKKEICKECGSEIENIDAISCPYCGANLCKNG